VVKIKELSPSHGGGPFEVMKRSYEPDNVSPGSLIPCVAAPILEKEKSQLNLAWGTQNLSCRKVFFLKIGSCRPFLNMFSKGIKILTLVALN
jgi:hypothetical protein